MQIALCQINPIVGALQSNADKIIGIIEKYSAQCDLLIFPELVLTGYPPQDLLADSQFIAHTEATLKRIASITSTAVIVGTVRREGAVIFNSAALMQNGMVVTYRDKTHLPTYDVFDEMRYFTPSKERMPVSLQYGKEQVNLGIQICEDLWDETYDCKVSKELTENGANIIINISASPFHVNRLSERLGIISDKAKQLKCNFIYCNLVGAQDELIFDGQSCMVNTAGEVSALLPAFEESVQIIDTETTSTISVFEKDEEEQIYSALTLGVSDYFHKTTHRQAVVGLSGGIDSALTAAIAANALGGENVLGISMPSQFSSEHSKSDAQELAKNLGIEYESISIKDINDRFLSELQPIFQSTEPGLAEENLQARIRGNLLMAVANKRNALLLNTGNKTETALGYCTMYGDMAGALAVISDLNKSQVYAVSRWINTHAGKTIIPSGTLTKPPSAELKPDQVDPFDYEIVSPLVDILITEQKTTEELCEMGYEASLVEELKQKIRIAEFKRRQAPPGLRVSSKAFGMGRRYPIVNQYKPNMSLE
ncbi:MAG: NAD+ synthase [Candidatus Marinimicrobia bacterium]|nr:NAD+ synthase [Candidatus Neomarinimicrobiota bacterium]